MWGLSLSHWVIVVFVVVLLFGKNTITRVMTDLAGAVRNTKKAFKEIESDITTDDNKKV